MQVVETAPVPCLCGRSSGPFVEVPYSVPGLTGLAHLCRDCVVELFGLFEAVPLVEHERLVEEFQRQIAEQRDRINVLTDAERELGLLRAEHELVQPTLDAHAAQVLGLEQTISEEQRKREEAEQLAAGNITAVGFKSGVAAAVEKAWAQGSSRRGAKKVPAA